MVMDNEKGRWGEMRWRGGGIVIVITGTSRVEVSASTASRDDYFSQLLSPEAIHAHDQCILACVIIANLRQ